MSGEQFTQGPYSVRISTGRSPLPMPVITMTGAVSGDLANLVYGLGCRFPGELEANARLFAASWSMFHALDEILNYEGGANTALEDPCVMDRARSAIAAALGETALPPAPGEVKS